MGSLLLQPKNFYTMSIVGDEATSCYPTLGEAATITGSAASAAAIRGYTTNSYESCLAKRRKCFVGTPDVDAIAAGDTIDIVGGTADVGIVVEYGTRGGQNYLIYELLLEDDFTDADQLNIDDAGDDITVDVDSHVGVVGSQGAWVESISLTGTSDAQTDGVNLIAPFGAASGVTTRAATVLASTTVGSGGKLDIKRYFPNGFHIDTLTATSMAQVVWCPWGA